MDLLHRFFENVALRDWLARFLVVLFLAGGATMLVTGLGLIFRSAATLGVFSRLNRWVSTRRTLRPVEVPREIGPAVQKHRRSLGTVFVAGGVFAIYSLATEWNARAAIVLLGLDIFRPNFAGWAVDSIRWILIAGNATGIVVGILLLFFPATLVALEARGARWYSERQLARNRDEMRFALDNWVARHPRAAGCVITFFAIALLGAFGLLLPATR